ncbi:hypothetical protein INT43_005475 [Umbelopsis isabellina]|uniref:CCR4-NOT transcription complex subunit 4 n=1 Tax=Mortierella isabellina TaxID=91625 RepID=A0A8H7U8P3_MORIS|nr:hypothetical protein INT43_005475 [Umbelopsis isabellina]
MSDVEDYDCPLCMEELDLSDRNFRPCPCGYQICRFCWHHIRENLNGRCPACRRVYSEQTVEFTPISTDEIQRIKKEKKEKERQQREMEQANRRHLENTRVVQKNLVYVIGLNPKYANEETIMSNDFFGQYGKISKIVINKRPPPPSVAARHGAAALPSVGVYVTYARKEDAARAITAVDGSIMGGRILRASYGTTKYCSYYLRNMACQNPVCMYLHDLGEDADSFSKEELALGKQNLRDQMSTEVDSKPQVLGQHTGPPTSADFPPMSSSYQGGRRPATLESVAHIQFKNKGDKYQRGSSPSTESFEDVSAANSDEEKVDEKSALPATVSWATGSGPSTPKLKSTQLALTPDNFGPSLAAAAASAKLQSQLKPPGTKKRKEKVRSPSANSTADEERSLSDGHVPQLVPDSGEEAENDNEEDFELAGFAQYVLGNAFRSSNAAPRLSRFNESADDDLEEEVVGVQALRDEPTQELEPVQDGFKDTLPITPFAILKTSISPYSETGYNGPFDPFAPDEVVDEQPLARDTLRQSISELRKSPTVHMAPLQNFNDPTGDLPMQRSPATNGMLPPQMAAFNSPPMGNQFTQPMSPQRQAPRATNTLIDELMRRQEPYMRSRPPGISPNHVETTFNKLSPQASMHLSILNNAMPSVPPEMKTQPAVSQPAIPNGVPMMNTQGKPMGSGIFQDSAILSMGNLAPTPQYNEDNQAPEGRRLRVFQGMRNTEPAFTQPVANNSNDIRAGLAALLNGANYPGKLGK